jgi:hypothetical protein
LGQQEFGKETRETRQETIQKTEDYKPRVSKSNTRKRGEWSLTRQTEQIEVEQ